MRSLRLPRPWSPWQRGTWSSSSSSLRGLSLGRMELDGRGFPAPLGLMEDPMEDADRGGGEPGGPGPEGQQEQLQPGQPQPPEEGLEEEEEASGAKAEGAAGAIPVELPPCHGAHGALLGELVVGQPPTERGPQDQEPRPMLPPRGKCLLDNWQEERATNPLDRVPCPEMGTESYFFRGGHRGLLTLDPGAGLARSTTAKDAFRTPKRTMGLPVRGQREAKLEWLLYQKHSKEVFAEQVQEAPRPMESQSTTHRDYRQEGFVSVPPAPTRPHDYRLEQPQTFWKENAQWVTGVSCIRTEDTPFRKCAAFTTPAAEYLEQPYDQETYPNF